MNIRKLRKTGIIAKEHGITHVKLTYIQQKLQKNLSPAGGKKAIDHRITKPQLSHGEKHMI